MLPATAVLLPVSEPVSQAWGLGSGPSAVGVSHLRPPPVRGRPVSTVHHRASGSSGCYSGVGRPLSLLWTAGCCLLFILKGFIFQETLL